MAHIVVRDHLNFPVHMQWNYKKSWRYLFGACSHDSVLQYIRSHNVTVFIALGQLSCTLVVWGNSRWHTAELVHVCVRYLDRLKDGRPSSVTAVRQSWTGEALIPRDVHTHTIAHESYRVTDESTSKWGGDTEHDSDRVTSDTQLCVRDRERDGERKQSTLGMNESWFLWALTLLGFLWASQSSDTPDFVTLPASV